MSDNIDWKKEFNGVYNYGWSCHYGLSHALELPEYKVRTYFAKSNAYVKSRYLVNCYVGKTDVMQEILYKTPHSNLPNDYVPISPIAFLNLFPDLKKLETPGYWYSKTDWWKYIELVEMEGRLLFKFKVEDWRKFTWGVNLNTIDHTFAGFMLRKFGPILGIASKYSDTIKSIEDAAIVWNKIRSLAATKFKRSGYYRDEISELRRKMDEQMRQIEQYDNQFDVVCNGAAEALDKLEKKFGLSVAV
jgi:hypothetical protein